MYAQCNLSVDVCTEGVGHLLLPLNGEISCLLLFTLILPAMSGQL